MEHLSEVGLDYWALGHVHTRREYALASGGVAVYPGNTQGRHGQEPGPRGCVLATVDASGRCERAFVALDPVRFAGARVEVSGVETIDGLVAAVDDATRPQAAEGVEAWVYRIVLEGRGPMHEELSRPGAFDQLVDAVRERLSRRGVHVEFVRNLTGPELDLENAGGLAACVLDVARAREFDALFEDEALKQVEGALRKAGLPSLRDCAEALTDAAAMRAVELLLEGA